MIEARLELDKEGKCYLIWKPMVRTLQLDNSFGILRRFLKLFIRGS